MAATRPLGGCPTCGSTEGDLGLRDFAKLTRKLPGKVGGTDFDFVIDQDKTGRLLILEFKRLGQYLDFGQRLALRNMVKAGADVWVVWEGKTKIKVGAMTVGGKVPFITEMTEDGLADALKNWWFDGFD